MKPSLIVVTLLLSLFLLETEGVAQPLAKSVRRYIRHGNKYFHTGQRDQATVEYMRAYQSDSVNALVTYNLATSLFPREWKLLSAGQRDTVVAHFDKAAQAEQNPIRRSMAYHNMGVAFQSGGDLRQAIEAYKNCLRCNPHDDEARYNLVLCQRQLKDQPQQNGDDGNNQQQQDQQEQQNQQQEQQPQDQQPQDQQPPQQQNQDWIEQMMNAAEQHERQVRRRLDEHQQGQPQRRRNEKNW